MSGDHPRQPTAALVRRSGPCWEDELLQAVRNGPVTVACHKDPLPRIRRVAPLVVGRGSGRGGRKIPARARLVLAVALQQAYAEGHPWLVLARLAGIRGDGATQAVRYYAGARPGMTGEARLYQQLRRDPARVG
jgi:hypothetical protein